MKDLFDTAGVTTTYGSSIFRDHVPKASAEAVLRLERAGYAVVGKTNLHEFAYGITSENQHFGDVRNPLDRARIPGGSSGGSAAALASGMCDAALGTDSGGSIRIPAACCGIVGFKPTHGLVPIEGVFPLAPSFDHAGPMARTVAGCVRMMTALVAGFAPAPIESLDDVAVGVAWVDYADAGVRERVAAASRRFPRRHDVAFPLPEGVSPAFRREVANVHRNLFAEHRDAYGDSVRTKVEQCLAVTNADYARAVAERERYAKAALDAMEGADLLLVPTLATVAPRVGTPEIELRESVIRLTFPFNALGWPVLALPCGAAEHGLPASLSLVGRPHADELVLAAGLALERELASARRRRERRPQDRPVG